MEKIWPKVFIIHGTTPDIHFQTFADEFLWIF